MATHEEIAKRDTYALIMWGDDFRFLEVTKWYENHFRDNVKIPSEKMSVVHCIYRNHDYMVQHMHDFLVKPSQTQPTNIILVYVGHGHVGSMFPNLENPINYEELASIFGEHDGSFVFINSACHSGSSIDVLTAKSLHKKGLILTSVPNDELAVLGDFERHVIDAYTVGKPFHPTKDMGDPLMTIDPREEQIEHEGKTYTALSFGPEPTYTKIPQRRGLPLDHLLYPK